MKFGEKVKELRAKKELSQPALAKLLGVSTRTIAAYESCTSYPRRKEMYDKLAEIFDVSVDYLRTENEEFITDAKERFGSRGEAQAKSILEQTQQLFAGGSLSEDDEIAFLREMQRIYLDSKERAKKYTPKKYLRSNDHTDV